MIFALARLTKRNETISMREGKCVFVCVCVCVCVCVFERERERGEGR